MEISGTAGRGWSDSPRVPITLAWPRLAAHPLVADFVASAERMRHRRDQDDT